MKRRKRIGTKKRSTKTPVIVKISLIIIVLFVIFATIFKITELILTNKSNDFPKLELSLKYAPIEEIDTNSKDTKYPNNTATLTANNESTLYENVEIKGRGNHTWKQIKKPYQIKFSEKTKLFNSEKANKWLLLANYVDPTHLRNDIAFFISDLLQEKYTPHGNFIELYTDNQYRGLYYLTEKIEIGKNRINLQNGDGVLAELDNSYGDPSKCFYDDEDNCIIIKELINEDLSLSTSKDFISFLNCLYEAIQDKDFKLIEKYIDVDSFAKYFILNEFVANPDAYSSSFFMYKDGENSKIYAGPGWDFDVSFGNKNWYTKEVKTEDIYSPFETMVFKKYLTPLNTSDTQYISTLLYDLMEIPEFETRVKEIYQDTLSGKGEEILDYIRSQAEYIRPAALRDQERWKLKTNFDEEIDYLIDWVAKRYDHFEQTYGVDSAPITPDPAPKSPQPSTK